MQKTNNIQHKAVRGGKALVLRHVFGFIVNFLGGVILARYFGPEIIGTYYISFTICMFGRALVDFGVLTHFIRLHEEPDTAAIKAAFGLQQIIGLCYVFICAVIVVPLAAKYYAVQGISWLIMSAAVASYFYSWQSVPLSLFERKVDYKKVGIVEVSEIISFNIAAVTIGLLKDDGKIGFCAGNILRGLVPAVIALYLGGVWPSLSFNYKRIKSLVKKTYPLFGININIYMVMIAPPVILGTLGGLKSYGMSMVAYVFLQYTMVIATIFQRVGLTSFARLQKKKKEFDNFVNMSLNILSVIYIPILMGLASFSPFILPLIYGPKWSGMEKIVVVAAIPLYLTALMGIFTSALVARGFYQLAMRQSTLNTVIYWVTMFVTVKYLDILTMPVAHLCGILGAGWILIYGYNRYCGKYIYKNNLFLSLSGIIVMLTGWYLAKNESVYLTAAVWSLFIIIIIYRQNRSKLPQLKRLLGTRE